MYGIARIDKVVAQYQVSLDPMLFPIQKMKVKILERPNYGYAAHPNLHPRNSLTGEMDYICGLGPSSEIAFDDLLTRFVADAMERSQNAKLTEEDFGWSDHEDF